MRKFNSGATRNDSDNKLDYEGFFSPLVIYRYAQYMHRNRIQCDGSERAADNWQKGMPRDEYMKSLYRHFMALWTIHRGENAIDEDTGRKIDIQDAICGIMFNAMGYLLEVLMKRSV